MKYKIPNPVFAHVPYQHLRGHLDYILDRKINPEIFLNGDALDTLLPEELIGIEDTLSSAGLKNTIHAPFMDLNPGSPEHLIRRATTQRFNQVMDAAEILRPVVMVFHSGYDKWRYGDNQETWLGNCIESFNPVVERADKIGCTIALENIFEEEPSTLIGLLDAFDTPILRNCFDVGHWNLFNKIGMEEWFSMIGSYIAEVHVHDNHGRSDEHLPIGEGNIDFDLFFKLMKQYAPDAVYTIEAHSKEKVESALKKLIGYLECR